jgi:hypothetical protein
LSSLELSLPSISERGMTPPFIVTESNSISDAPR